MRFLVSLLTCLAVMVMSQTASAGPAKPSPSAANSETYTAYNQEESGGCTRISLSITMVPQGKIFQFTGVLTYVLEPVQKFQMKGTFDPATNRLVGKWCSADIKVEPQEYDVSGSQRPDRNLEVTVNTPAVNEMEAKAHRFVCIAPPTGLLAPFPPRPARPADLTKKGLWYGMIEITMDPKKLNGLQPWDVCTDQNRKEHGMREFDIKRRKVKYAQAWLDDKGNVKGEWTCNWTYDEPPAIFALGPRYKFKIVVDCEIRKRFEPTYYDMFSCWMDAGYDTDRTGVSPNNATWNGLPAKWSIPFLGLANKDSLGHDNLVTGQVINHCEAFWDTDILDAFGDKFTIHNITCPPEYLHFKVRVGSIVAIYKYKLRTKPKVK